MELDKYPQAIQPSFWIVVVAAGGTGLANIQFYQSRCVAYTKQEATQAVLKQLATEAPQLHAEGQQLGGWRVTHVDGIAAADMEKLFNERCDRERQRVAEAVHLETNHLLQQIIRDKDVKLFHQAIREGRITPFERLYIHDKLTEGQELKATDSPTISPIKL